MHLKSITLRGFKSFADRTRLDFGPGVSVVVGPNGSGKSNVTDAVLWALGEQSPLAVRGQSMQDVIFGGGRGVAPRQAAEVEIVLDNGDESVDLPLSEISVLRRLDRSGEGEYRLNGARCRLVDVIEVLSDTGLGREMHSVISQGRVESIVTSKPRDRRMLIEEAAGLGKHRKRRRRAQLKLERTQENLDRALDVEREARTRLRPLKRQAEAAELHARLEQQLLQARWELARDALRERRIELATAETAAHAAREAREGVEARLAEVIARREEVEQALTQRSEHRDALGRRAYAARSAEERLGLRLEQARATVATLQRRATRAEIELEALAATTEQAGPEPDRLAELEAELGALDRRREEDLAGELAELERARDEAFAATAGLEEELAALRSERSATDERVDAARGAQRAAERDVEAARREAARVGAELAAANQFLRSHGGRSGADARTLGDELRVAAGYELAVAAVLGERLGAALVGDLPAAGRWLDRAGGDGGATIVSTLDAPGGSDLAGRQSPGREAPVPGARPLLEFVTGEAGPLALARALLADAWVVEDLDGLPATFAGIAVTRAGRSWRPLPDVAAGELHQAAVGGAERVLARRNERDRLVAESERAAQAELDARGRAERAAEDAQAADAARDEADRAVREADRRRAEAAEHARRGEWLIEQRRAAPEQGPLAVRRAEIEGELAAERRQAERAERERLERERRVTRLRAQREADLALAPRAERLAAAVEVAIAVVQERRAAFEHELAADRAAGEEVAAQMRACASAEAEIHAELRACGEAVTSAEVDAQRLRDLAEEAQIELTSVAEQLGANAEPGTTPLQDDEAEALRTRIERVQRRREQLGPVNPLAGEEYAEAVSHVEELETRRNDLETALRELRGIIRDTDRQIKETFEETFAAAAANFEQLVQDVFPGGQGRMRLVHDDAGPRPVLGGGQLPEGEEAGDADAEMEAAADAEDELTPDEDLLGVEIELAPAGKSTKRLSLLSGGEKSMTALAFLFAVFLARPCPFYIMDEVEAALDDLNLDRFLGLLRRYSGRAQFIVITHQKRTMEAADWLYGVSMGGDGVSKVISRRLPAAEIAPADAVVA